MPKSIHRNAYLAVVSFIVDARKMRNVTQIQLAKKVGKPQSYISKIETGERRIDIIELFDIMDGLGIPHDTFLPILYSKVKEAGLLRS